MKNSEKLVVGAMLVLTCGLFGGNVLAADYDGSDPLKATGHGTVRFEESDVVEIIDPETVDPVSPTNPTNPAKGDLVIQYVSDFDFGTHKNDLKTFSGLASADEVQKINPDGSKEPVHKVPSFISTKDMRAIGNGWELKVTPSAFETPIGGHVLAGAEVSLSGLVYNTGKDNAPTPTSGTVKLVPGTAYSIAKAKKDKGMGSYSLAFGTLNGDNQVTGVVLDIPKNTIKDTKEAYVANFDWELVADPTLD